MVDMPQDGRLAYGKVAVGLVKGGYTGSSRVTKSGDSVLWGDSVVSCHPEDDADDRTTETCRG